MVGHIWKLEKFGCFDGEDGKEILWESNGKNCLEIYSTVKRGEERRVFQKDGIIRKVKEKNGASGSCQWLDFRNYKKKKWEAGLVGLNAEVAYGGNFFQTANWDIWSNNRYFLICEFIY